MSTDARLKAVGRTRQASVKSILVAVDDSEPARWALDQAVRLAESLEARVSLVHVVEVPLAFAPDFAFEEALRRPALVQASKEMVKRLAGHVPAELLGKQIVRAGSVDKQIIAAAQQIPADLLVIGTHSRGLLGRFLLGRVAESVVRHATCPVLTVGHPPEGRAPGPRAIEISQVEAGTVQGA